MWILHTTNLCLLLLVSVLNGAPTETHPPLAEATKALTKRVSTGTHILISTMSPPLPDDEKRLTNENCQNKAQLSGTFREFYIYYDSNKDEGSIMTVICSVRFNSKCKSFVKEVLKDVVLLQDGVKMKNAEKQTTTGYSREVDFHVLLNFEEHNNTVMQCQWANGTDPLIVSRELHLGHIDEYFDVQITPVMQTVIFGEAYTLKCVSSKRGAGEVMAWYRTNMEILYSSRAFTCTDYPYTCTGTHDTFSKTLVIQSQTTDTAITRFKYVCGTYTDHGGQPRSEATVLLQLGTATTVPPQPKDKTMMITCAVCGGIFLALVCALIAIASFLVRRRQLQSRVTMSMCMAEVHGMVEEGGEVENTEQVHG